MSNYLNYAPLYNHVNNYYHIRQLLCRDRTIAVQNVYHFVVRYVVCYNSYSSSRKNNSFKIGLMLNLLNVLNASFVYYH